MSSLEPQELEARRRIWTFYRSQLAELAGKAIPPPFPDPDAKVRMFVARFRLDGSHYWLRLFVGFEGETFAQSGELSLRQEEFEDFKAACSGWTFVETPTP